MKLKFCEEKVELVKVKSDKMWRKKWKSLRSFFGQFPDYCVWTLWDTPVRCSLTVGHLDGLLIHLPPSLLANFICVDFIHETAYVVHALLTLFTKIILFFTLTVFTIFCLFYVDLKECPAINIRPKKNLNLSCKLFLLKRPPGSSPPAKKKKGERRSENTALITVSLLCRDPAKGRSLIRSGFAQNVSDRLLSFYFSSSKTKHSCLCLS